MSTGYLDAAGLNTLASCFFESNVTHVGNAAVTGSNIIYATALGASANAYTNHATAVGAGAKAVGNYSTALGRLANASGNNSTALGRGTTAVGNYSTSLGYLATAKANYSLALGALANASSANSIVLGSSGVSSLECAVELTTTSDERDKTDVAQLEDACGFLANVRAVTYLRNPRAFYLLDEEELDEDGVEKREKYGLYGYDAEAWEAGERQGERQRVGVIAQEVQAALESTYGTADYANLVNDSLHDYDDVPDDVESQLSVNYAGFVPFLIEAVNELRERVESLEGASE